MKVQSVVLTANVKQTLGGGNFFMLVETSAALDVQLLKNGAPSEKGESVEAGYKAKRPEEWSIPGRYFDAVELTSATTQTIKIGISEGEGGYDRNVGNVDATITQGTTITNTGAVAVNDATEVVAIAAASGRKALRFRAPAANTGKVYLGATGVTPTNGGIELAPGEMWNEDNAADAAWYAISDIGAQNVVVQVLT